MPCALAPVPTDGVLNQACPEPDPASDPEPDPEPSDGRMLFEVGAAPTLFEADGGHEKSGFFHEDRHTECADKPDHLVALAAENLGLPAATCAELAGDGACELDRGGREPVR